MTGEWGLAMSTPWEHRQRQNSLQNALDTNTNTNTKIQIQMVSNVDPLGISATAELASNTEADTNDLDTNVAREFIIYIIDICKSMKAAKICQIQAVRKRRQCS